MRSSIGRSAGRTLGRTLVVTAGAAFWLSTMSGLWVTTLLLLGGQGRLVVHGSATPWDGYFMPWPVIAGASLTVAAAVAAFAGLTESIARRSPSAKAETAVYLVAGAAGSVAMAIALWLGPGGSHRLDTTTFITRPGVLAVVAMLVAAVPLIIGLASLRGPRLVPVAATALLVVFAVGLALRPVPFRPQPVSGPVPDWRADPNEPYPFSTPVPPLVPTAIDGSYDRAPTENYPDRPGCTRCQPYPLDAGRSILTFDRGRFRLEQQQPRYQSGGHYVVAGTHVTLFNDPECTAVRGVYRWAVDDGRLTLTVLFDPCAFGQRARDLTDRVWEVIER